VKAKAELAAEDRVLEAPWSAPVPARRPSERFRNKLRAGELNDREIEIEVADSGGPMPSSRSRASRARQSA
jgi:ATP-dependent HslUV protease ATP-binding subunit HslU